MDTLGYPSGADPQSVAEKGLTEEQLKGFLAELISSSADLNVRVWLDGVYTAIEETRIYGDWMKGREVYFKVEGKVKGLNDSDDQSRARSD